MVSKAVHVYHIVFMVPGCYQVERFGDICRLEYPSFVSKHTKEVVKWMHSHASYKPASPYEQIKPKIDTMLFYQTGSDEINPQTANVENMVSS
jgi:hypothetical protein